MDGFEQSNVNSVWSALTCEICLEYSGLDLSTSLQRKRKVVCGFIVRSTAQYNTVQCNFKNLKRFVPTNSWRVMCEGVVVALDSRQVLKGGCGPLVCVGLWWDWSDVQEV